MIYGDDLTIYALNYKSDEIKFQNKLDKLRKWCLDCDYLHINFDKCKLLHLGYNTKFKYN